jgi:3'-5' exoribonuclease
MKTNYVKDLKKGEALHGEYFAIRAVKELKTKKGDLYLDIKFQDFTGEITGKVWKDSIAQCDTYEEGKIVAVDATVDEFNGSLQLTVFAMAEQRDFNPEDFMPSSGHDKKEMFSRYTDYIKSVKDPYISELLHNIFVKDHQFAMQFIDAFAGEKAHHAYSGGLLEHFLELLDFAEPIYKVYPNVNRDILIAGIMLHDIGKIFELPVDLTVSRSREGHLLGHIVQGIVFVKEHIDKVEGFPAVLKDQILHMIASHHGKLEFGSPVKPMTIEAIALHFVDNLSTKLNIATRVENQCNNDFSNFEFLLDGRLYVDKYSSPVKGKMEMLQKSVSFDANDLQNSEVYDSIQTDGEDRNLQIPF